MEKLARWLKSRLRRDSLLWRLLRTVRLALGIQIRGRKVHAMLKSLDRSKQSVFFIQIGSNDASQGDPLSRFVLNRPWSGIMVEPVKYVFDRLAQSYGQCTNLALENIAIAATNGAQDFFHLAQSDDDLPSWYTQLGSFSRQTVLAHADRIPDIEDRIVCTPVPCMTFDALCQKHSVGQIDLIHIDTEGYDFQIIKLIDFDRYQPTLVIYEHKHLSDDDQADCRSYLESKGYQAIEDGRDTLAMRGAEIASAGSRLARTWKSLKEAA